MIRNTLVPIWLLALASLAAIAAEPAPAPQRLPTLELKISGIKIVAEIAATDPTRMVGLMYRKKPLAANHGMLFVFTASGFHSMWMQNTYIPLSVAFIDDNGVILNIADMMPQTTQPHTAAGFARYALEMNQGWFASHGIRAGAKVEGLAAAPAPK